jgi:hypothetical protein
MQLINEMVAADHGVDIPKMTQMVAEAANYPEGGKNIGS